MHRVFIATDDLTRPDYWLHHPRSVADLAAMGAGLAAGAPVTLCAPGGGQLAATLHFQAEVNCWIAYPAR
jgi:hypothetical protein